MIERDFARGKKGENRLVDLFKDFGHLINYNANEEYRPFYDLEFSLVSTDYHIITQGSIEVKNDEFAAKTGNLAFEFYNGRSLKPSGITITKADIWAHIAFSEIWVANTKILQRFIKCVEPYRIKYGVGDGNADIFLYKKDRIFNGNLFVRIDHLDRDSFTKTIQQTLWKDITQISLN